jgi:hypothetical protein
MPLLETTKKNVPKWFPWTYELLFFSLEVANSKKVENNLLIIVWNLSIGYIYVVG